MINTASYNGHAAPFPTFTDEVARQDTVQCPELGRWRGVVIDDEARSLLTPEGSAAARLRALLNGALAQCPVTGIEVVSAVPEWLELRVPCDLGAVVLTLGDSHSDVPTLVRIHSQCMTGDVFGSVKCDCGRQLRNAMALIEKEGRGAIVYQQQEGRGIGIMNKIRAYALQDAGADTIEANVRLGLDVDPRQYQQCAEIFLDLGLRSVRVMSNNPAKIRALEDAGLKVTARVPLEIPPTPAAFHYLRTKKEKMGHLLESV
jgi:3,4-dihydroxy 2-butanone 4-phosphate synthase/GTP cyclohydrolase II